jgi:hypothetical protein
VTGRPTLLYPDRQPSGKQKHQALTHFKLDTWPQSDRNLERLRPSVASSWLLFPSPHHLSDLSVKSTQGAYDNYPMNERGLIVGELAYRP